jgi:pimeloyl-ACP methyl ester carboxylesterase
VNGGSIIEHRLRDISVPTLILHGADDPTVPVAHAYEMAAAIPDAELHIYPDTGHLPHRAHEADVRARVLGFLTAHGAHPNQPIE